MIYWLCQEAQDGSMVSNMSIGPLVMGQGLARLGNARQVYTQLDKA